MAVGFEDPRVKVHIEDGNEFMRRHKNNFDIIITDSSDPIGPAASLFKEPYYENIKEALKPRGTLCSQGTFLIPSSVPITTVLGYVHRDFSIFPLLRNIKQSTGELLNHMYVYSHCVATLPIEHTCVIMLYLLYQLLFMLYNSVSALSTFIVVVYIQPHIARPCTNVLYMLSLIRWFYR